MTMLYVREESGYREATRDDVMDCAQALIARNFCRGAPVMGSTAPTREFLRIHLGACEHEVFGLLHLNVRHRLIAVEEPFRGTIDGVCVHPRQVVTSALSKNAS